MGKQTQYTIADALKEMGIEASTQPYQDAVEGFRIIVIAMNKPAADICQRNYYMKLLQDKMPIKEARPSKIYFESGGILEIVTPGVMVEKFRGLDRQKTKYSIYRH